MDTGYIRSLVNTAVAHEENTHHLKQSIEKHLQDMHSSIKVEDDQSVEKMVNFVIEYINQVPDLLDALKIAADDSGLIKCMQPLMDLATEFFTIPPDVVNSHIGLNAMMDEAYLAHRLVEEINDRFITQLGTPLIPMDLTTANVIIHNMIGEPFANNLDEIAHHNVDKLMGDSSIFLQDDFQTYVEKHKEEHTTSIWKNWPCLSGDMGISLSFGN